MHEAKLARLFDLVGEEFDDRDQIFLRHYQQMSVVCQACFKPEEISGKNILDAGCGTGTASIYFARNKAASVIGADLSSKSLAVGDGWKRRYDLKNTEFQQADLLKMPFGSAQFDMIFSCGALP